MHHKHLHRHAWKKTDKLLSHITNTNINRSNHNTTIISLDKSHVSLFTHIAGSLFVHAYNQNTTLAEQHNIHIL